MRWKHSHLKNQHTNFARNKNVVNKSKRKKNTSNIEIIQRIERDTMLIYNNHFILSLSASLCLALSSALSMCCVCIHVCNSRETLNHCALWQFGCFACQNIEQSVQSLQNRFIEISLLRFGTSWLVFICHQIMHASNIKLESKYRKISRRKNEISMK